MSQPRYWPQYTSLPAQAGDAVIKSAGGGVLGKVIVITTGANPMQIFDNASAGSGTQIGALPANPAVGTVFNFEVPCVNGITVKGSATNPGVVILWS